MNLYTRSDLYRFDERVQDEIDKQLDSMGGWNADRDRIAHSLDRLRGASNWLTMMQRCVKTEAQVIALDDSVACVMFDYYLRDKDAKVKS